jgi:hypothetical protein
MSRSDYNALIARGRKAGLSTRELYAALSSVPAEAHEEIPGESDGNGYASEIDESGHRVYRPVKEEGR